MIVKSTFGVKTKLDSKTEQEEPETFYEYIMNKDSETDYSAPNSYELHNIEEYDRIQAPKKHVYKVPESETDTLEKQKKKY